MIRVLIVDDSATARALISEILNSAIDIEIVGTAPDAYVARDMVVELKPDVICLDVEMPKMDGLTFLKKLMQHFPIPTVMVSSLTKKGAAITLDALDAGAIDFVQKPHSNIYEGIEEIQKELIYKVRTAARAQVVAKVPLEKYSGKVLLSETTKKVIAIGASTGGTRAIQELLMRMPRNSPGMIIVQHMPESFTEPFATRLNELCELNVREAKNGDLITIGEVLIAPGKYHMVLRQSGGQYKVQLGTGDPVSGHRPSVDVMFNSVAKTAGSNAIGIILTGMGADGAKGITNMYAAGAHTIAQDEKSCVVYGMPKEAVALGGIEQILPLNNIANATVSLLEK
mgnify:CR=1 FL=1|jgi:two-component system, chemotaxis family, protein-glutamate methylesterase/glutaminase